MSSKEAESINAMEDQSMKSMEDKIKRIQKAIDEATKRYEAYHTLSHQADKLLSTLEASKAILRAEDYESMKDQLENQKAVTTKNMQELYDNVAIWQNLKRSIMDEMRAIESTERRSGEARVTMEETLDSGIGSIGTPKRAIDLDKPGQMN